MTEVLEYYDNPFDPFFTHRANGLVDLQYKKILPEFLQLVNRFCSNTLIPQLPEAVLASDGRDYSVYTGTMGVALLYHLLGERLGQPAYLQRGIELVEEALPRLKRSRVSFMTGDAGPLAVGALLYHKQGDKNRCTQLVIRLLSLLKDVLELDNDELLYGRAGYLYALLFVNKYVGPDTVQPYIIKQVVAAILASGQKRSAEVKSASPLLYVWHDKQYLGAAHGLSGILYILLQAKEYLSQAELETLVQPSVDFLIAQRFHSANLPSSLGNQRDRLVQWCHGVPGLVQLLCLAYEVFGSERYLVSALDCGEVVWYRGLLTKGYGLCHGVAGNAYTFLTLYQTTKDMKHLYRCSQFAYWCTFYPRRQKREPDRPLSLMEGMAGVLYLLIDFQIPTEARFPAFTL